MSAAGRQLARALEACAGALAAGADGASRRAAVREAWRREAHAVHARIARAVAREALVCPQPGEEARRDAERVERTACAALRNASARFAHAHGLDAAHARQTTARAARWATVWANACVASARRSEAARTVAAHIAGTEHSAHVKLREAAGLAPIDEAQWRHVRRAPPWMVRAALEGAGPGTGSPWTWVGAACTRAAKRAGESGAPAPEGAVRASAQSWPCRAVRPPMVAVWAHAHAGRSIDGAPAWDAALQWETHPGGAQGAEAIVERCATLAERFEQRVRRSLKRWWDLYASGPMRGADTAGLERRWKETDPKRRHPAGTQLLEDQGTLVWEASLDDLWAVLCAAREATTEEVCSHRAVRIEHLHEREWTHRCGWGARATEEEAEQARRTTGAFLEWMQRTWWRI